jgi:hypothetical protein
MSTAIPFVQRYDAEHGTIRICRGCGAELEIGDTWTTDDGETIVEFEHGVLDCLRSLKAQLDELKSAWMRIG